MLFGVDAEGARADTADDRYGRDAWDSEQEIRLVCHTPQDARIDLPRRAALGPAKLDWL